MKSIFGLALGLASLAALASADAPAGASLPLERGVYIDSGSPCRGAASAARSWFGGGFVIQAPHARCELKSATQAGPTDYVVSLRCYENGDPALPYDVVDKVKIVSPREYQLENQFGRFQARWCRA
jgi:hypothetical protein